ncbi:MAG: LAGLIDADG family homing endonuclease [Candidatus Woesearchaeota archaeon]|nr:hypothetical protein [Nanoarchaeota archaeon]
MEKRVVFPKGKQREFLVSSRKELKLTWPEFAEKVDTKRKTLEKAYRYEYCSMPYGVFSKIVNERNINKKRLIRDYNIKIVKGSRYGAIGRKVLGEKRAKLGNINLLFENSIHPFNTSVIKLSKYDEIKRIKFPNKLTPELAEEIGMHIGDGFLSKRRNEYRLKGNKNNEKDYYKYFIKKLYKTLFNLDINLKEYESTYGFEISSKGLWTFKNKILGIPSGKKDDIDLPAIIKVNDKDILTSFIRGVFDTDGCVNFKSGYGLKGYYPRIEITMLSKDLIGSISEILYALGLKPYKHQDKLGYWHITLNGYERFERYNKLIGWHNPKHLRKIKKWKKQYPKLGKDVMVGVV